VLENGTPGSVRGASGNRRPYRDGRKMRTDGVNQQMLALKGFAILTILASLGTQGSVAAGQHEVKAPALIGTIDETFACGTGFRTDPKSEGPLPPWVFLEDLDEAPKMKIEGKVVELKLTSSNEPDRDLRKNDRVTRTYAAGEIKVTMELRVTFVCPANDPSESCEHTEAEAKITVTRGDRTQSMMIYGGWGC